MDINDTIVRDLLEEIDSKKAELLNTDYLLGTYNELVSGYNNRIKSYEEILGILDNTNPTMKIVTENGGHLLLGNSMINYKLFKDFVIKSLNNEILKLTTIIDGITV